MHFNVNQVLRIDAKMYRHFAVATLVITLCVAFFADGTNRQAVSAEYDKRDQQLAARMAKERKASDKHITFTSKVETNKPMDEDEDVNFGAPMDRTGLSGQAAANYAPRASTQPCGRAAADRHAMARMSEAQLKAYLASLDKMDCSGAGPSGPGAGAAPHQPSSAEVQAVMQASAARSGSVGVE